MKSSGKSTKEKEALATQLRSITGATSSDATRLLKKANYNLERAIDHFYSDSAAQQAAISSQLSSSSSSGKSIEKKLGDIWESYKDASSSPPLITIEGTMKLCEDLEIDPENDPILFCLAADLGSKTVGEWPKDGWVKGWRTIDASVESLAGMKAQLPRLRKKLNENPEYFKKVYGHTFTMSLQPGARVLALDSAISFWQVFFPAALSASPSALSHITNPSTGETTDPAFTDLDDWLEFMKARGKPVSKDVWGLFVDFVRTIDPDYANYDEDGAWPSVIDEFYASQRAKKTAGSMDTSA
ncbi:Cullin binding-domain-containing protein [Filobasidium floriforme]|uniref:Cullin binding-domain-containing protein n=1 Tax=Filobasidium floriforme TaxID=5210 RepID=UPI001E8CFE25|nr:Cullin binding-domain-containing protein [Filobasidium floriforme]KAH8077913.1 Cullin binding-domain-containing protein [Filobasidium floriforme]